MFRPVPLPRAVAGRLWLHSMPGRQEPLEQAWAQIRINDVQTIVCLVTRAEVRGKSPEYAAALDAKTVPCDVEMFPIPDFGVPDDRETFWAFARRIAGRLEAGRRVLVHCGAGIGRTGTLATCVLLGLGETEGEARRVIAAAGSHTETPEQIALASWCATRARGHQ